MLFCRRKASRFASFRIRTAWSGSKRTEFPLSFADHGAANPERIILNATPAPVLELVEHLLPAEPLLGLSEWRS